MREADLTDGRWWPLAHHLAARFAASGGSDEGMMRAAVAAILDVEGRLGSRRGDFSALAVPLVIRALRRYQREQLRNRPASARPLPALQLEIAAAESELSRHLRRSPTVTEVAEHLEVAQDRIVAGLEAGWSAGYGTIAA